MQHSIRPLGKDETKLLEDFLLLSIFVPEEQKDREVPRSILQKPDLRVYIDDFGKQPDDRALVAEVDGKVVGVVWSRIMDDYGHIDDETPSLAISLRPEWRGQRIGTALMEEILALLAKDGYPAVSLSVQRANHAAHLYKRLGFEVVQEHPEEWIMRRSLC